MKHFIILEQQKQQLIYVRYFSNNECNKIGDFSTCCYYIDGFYRKYKTKNGNGYYEDNSGSKEWYRGEKRYKSYEEYLLESI